MRMAAPTMDVGPRGGVTGLAYRDMLVTCRALLITGAAGLLLPVTGCSGSSSGAHPASPSGLHPGAAPSVAARLAGLERRFGARLGVYTRDTGSGAAVIYQADERFPMCSTYKVLAAAAVLHRDSPAELDKHVSYSRADLVEHSPVTAAHLAAGMTVEQLCQAAVSYGDNTAANLLLRELGGPAGVTAYARSLADHVTRLDRTEPDLNQATPGDDRDTTSPRAIGADFEAVVIGTALTPENRSLLTRWLVSDTTGAGEIRAAVPAGWMVGDKTGTGGYGTDNDIAILWPPQRSPIVLAVMSTRTTPDAQPSNALIAAATRTVLPAL
jgi:beta-lactamase class A